MRSGPCRTPERCVATSLPAAALSLAPDATALLPSTAPELFAKFTAATAVPDRPTASATIATTIAGEGSLGFIWGPPPQRT